MTGRVLRFKITEKLGHPTLNNFDVAKLTMPKNVPSLLLREKIEI